MDAPSDAESTRVFERRAAGVSARPDTPFRGLPGAGRSVTCCKRWTKRRRFASLRSKRRNRLENGSGACLPLTATRLLAVICGFASDLGCARTRPVDCYYDEENVGSARLDRLRGSGRLRAGVLL
jgi:hypothetical protein